LRVPHRQTNRRHPARLTENPSGGEQPEAQRRRRDSIHPAQMPWKQLGQVVAQDGQAQGRPRAPELLQAQLGQREVRVQLLDHFFAAGPRVVLPPHFQRRHPRRQVGDQALIEASWAIQERLAPVRWPAACLSLILWRSSATRRAWAQLTSWCQTSATSVPGTSVAALACNDWRWNLEFGNAA